MRSKYLNKNQFITLGIIGAVFLTTILVLTGVNTDKLKASINDLKIM